MKGRDSLPAILAVLTDEWKSTQLIAIQAGVHERVVRDRLGGLPSREVECKTIRVQAKARQLWWRWRKMYDSPTNQQGD